MTASFLATLALLAPFAVHPAPASALPIFARRYGVSCQACHSIVPRLSAFGQAFKNSGYRWPAALTPAPTLPVAVRVNLAYSSLPDPTGLPKAIVDEVEALSAGPLGKHFSYYAEQYLVDGGRPGKTRDAYLEYLSDPMQAWKGTGGVGVRWEALAGQFTLPLPVDPETMRPTENHYAVFDQIVGDNPFNFFDPRIGIDVGAVLRDAELRVLFIKGHDPQSGLPTAKPDTMFAARLGSDRLALFGYAYLGTRPLGQTNDAFRRRGIALKSVTGRSRFTALLQTGLDTDANAAGNAVFSSGGFVQEEYTIVPWAIAVVRADRTFDALAGPLHSMTYSLNVRPYARSRFTIEYVAAHQPGITRELNLGWLFAY